MKTLVVPPRCVATLPEDLEKDHFIGEEKLDGSRYILYIGHDPYERQKNVPNTLLSRRLSVKDGKHVDRSENLPHITGQEYKGLEGTILDGEVMGEKEDGKVAGSSILLSSPALAVQKQEAEGWLSYNVFDISFFRGEDIRGLPLTERRKVLEAVVARMNNQYVKAIPQFKGDLASHFQKIVSKGGEGIIVKDVRCGYGVGWAKMKRSTDISVVITGWKPGNGKYSAQIGSLALGVYFKGELIEVGFASGFDDTLRTAMSKNFEKYKGKVIDVYAQEITKPSAEHKCGRLRHPTFFRIRDDVNAKDCTYEKITADLKKRVLNKRFRGAK